jgi:hypothetical protein
MDLVLALVARGNHDDAAGSCLAGDRLLDRRRSVMRTEVTAEAEIDHRRPVLGLLEDAADSLDDVSVEQRFAADADEGRIRRDAAEASL